MMNRKKFSKTLAAVVLAAGMLVGTTTTAFAYVDPAAETTEATTEATTETQTPEQETPTTEQDANQTEATQEETPTTADDSPFSVPGNGEIQDDVTDGSSKEFLTIRTANNNTFYVVIDRASTTENVYMLSTIDEDDLQEFLTDSEKEAGATVVLDEQPVTTTPALEETKEDAPAKTSTNKGALLGILAVALCGLAGYYYFKIYRPKREEEDEDNQDLELSDGLETINEDENERKNRDDVKEVEDSDETEE